MDMICRKLDQASINISPDCYVFVTDLLSQIISQSIDSHSKDECTRLFHHLMEAPSGDLLRSTSVRHAHLKALGNVITNGNPQQIKWIQSKNLMSFVFKSHADTSLFVRRAALSCTSLYIWELLLLCHEKKSVVEPSEVHSLRDEVSSLTSRIFDSTNVSLSSDKSWDVPLDVLQHLCTLSAHKPQVMTHWMVQHSIRDLIFSMLSQSIKLNFLPPFEKILSLLMNDPIRVEADDQKLTEIACACFTERKTFPALLTASHLLKSPTSPQCNEQIRRMIDIVLKAAASVEIQAENEWLIAHLNENRQKCQRTVGCCLDAMKLIKPSEGDLSLLVCLLSVTCGQEPADARMAISHVVNSASLSLRTMQTICVLVHTSAQAQSMRSGSIMDLSSVLLSKIHESTCAYQLLSQSFICLLTLMRAASDIKIDILQMDVKIHNAASILPSPPITKFGDALCDVLQKKLCDMQWEIRDTSLEFLTKLLKEFKDDDQIIEWLVSSGQLRQVWQCVQDGERYVRATALEAMTCLMHCKGGWQAFISIRDEKEIIGAVCDILSDETEAFPRRAAVNFISSWFFKCATHLGKSSEKDLILKALQHSANDFDWQVKISVLDFYDQYWDSLTGTSNEEVICDPLGRNSKRVKLNPEEEYEPVVRDFTSHGGAYVLMHSLEDYDQSVQHKACELALRIHSALRGTTSDGNSQNKKLKQEEISVKINNGSELSVESFFGLLSCLDLNEKLRESEYTENVDSFLSDLVTSVKQASQDSPSEDVNEGDTFGIDCY